MPLRQKDFRKSFGNEASEKNRNLKERKKEKLNDQTMKKQIKFRKQEVQTFELISIYGTQSMKIYKFKQLQAELSKINIDLATKEDNLQEMRFKLEQKQDEYQKIKMLLEKQLKETQKLQKLSMHKDVTMKEQLSVLLIENEQKINKANFNLRLLKIFEKIEIQSIKSTQRAFFKLKFNCHLEKRRESRDLLNNQIQDHLKTINQQNETKNQLQAQLKVNNETYLETSQKLQRVDNDFKILKEKTDQQINQKDQEFMLLQSKLEQKNKQVTDNHKQRLMKMVVYKFLSSANIDLQRAFLLLKMNCQERKLVQNSKYQLDNQSRNFMKYQKDHQQAQRQNIVKRLILKKYLDILNMNFKHFRINTVKQTIVNNQRTIQDLQVNYKSLQNALSQQQSSFKKDRESSEQKIHDMTIKIQEQDQNYRNKVDEYDNCRNENKQIQILLEKNQNILNDKDLTIKQQKDQVQKLQNDIQSQEIKVGLKIREEQMYRRAKIIKIVVNKIIHSMNSGKQKAFYIMKMRTQELKNLQQIKQTQELSFNRLNKEKQSIIIFKKREMLKIMAKNKQQRLKYFAFNRFRIVSHNFIIDQSKKNINSLKSIISNQNEQQIIKEQQILQTKKQIKIEEARMKQKEDEAQNTINDMRLKYSDLEKQNKQIQQSNNQMIQNIQQKEKKLKDNQYDLQCIKKQLAEQKKELENQESFSKKELQVAAERYKTLQKSTEQMDSQVKNQQLIIEQQEQNLKYIKDEFQKACQKSRNQFREEQEKRKQKLLKMVVIKILSKLSIGQYRAFQQMKINAIEYRFEVRLDQTIKSNQNEIIQTKLNQESKAKPISLRKISYRKQFRLQMRAFNQLKHNSYIHGQNLKDITVKQLQEQFKQISMTLSHKDKLLKFMEENNQDFETKREEIERGYQEKIDELSMKHAEMQKQLMEIQDQNISKDLQQKEKEKLLKQHQDEIELVKKLLAEKELELQNERSLKLLEIQAAQEKLTEISDESQKQMNKQLAQIQEKLDRQMKINRDLRKSALQPNMPQSLAQFQPDRRYQSEKRRIEQTDRIEELEDEHNEEEIGRQNQDKNDEKEVNPFIGFQLKKLEYDDANFGQIQNENENQEKGTSQKFILSEMKKQNDQNNIDQPFIVKQFETPRKSQENDDYTVEHSSHAKHEVDKGLFERELGQPAGNNKDQVQRDSQSNQSQTQNNSIKSKKSKKRKNQRDGSGSESDASSKKLSINWLFPQYSSFKNNGQ